MTFSRTTIFALAAVMMLSGASALAQDTTLDAETITALLKDDDPASNSRAVAGIRALMESQASVIASRLRSDWLLMLQSRGRYEDVLDLAQWTVLEMASSTPAVESLQEMRVRAFLKLGRNGEAMAAARGLFNVAGMATTDRALQLLAECFNASHPGDIAFVEQFRQEQIAGATTQPTTRRAVAKSMLLAIAIDPKPYEEAIRRYDAGRYVVRADESRDLLGEGNLLLLAGRAKEAQGVFQRALSAADSDQRSAALEAYARAIKAEDGTIGRANAWVRSVQTAPAR